MIAQFERILDCENLRLLFRTPPCIACSQFSIVSFCEAHEVV